MVLVASRHPTKEVLRRPTEAPIAVAAGDDAFGDLGFSRIVHDDDDKCEWMRSQIIGVDAEFEGPFGRRRITYSDHTASGRFLRFVEDYVQKDVLPFYGNTHTSDSYVGRRTTDLMNRSVRYIKQSCGARKDDILLFCGSGSTAAIKRLQEVVGVAVPSILRQLLIHQLPPSHRWVVFVGPYEHHSNLLSWRQSLAQVVEIGLDRATGRPDTAALKRALASPEFAGRPKLGSFSACSNVSGVLTDTRSVARLLHRYGAFACFDFACNGPYVDIDMRSGDSDGYDAVFLSPHKFPGGPGSPGILLMSSRLYKLNGAPPSTSGGGTVRFVGVYNTVDTVYSEDLEEREDAGTPAIVQRVRAAAAFRVKDWMGHVAIQERERRMAQLAVQRLVRNKRIRVLGVGSEEERQPIVSFIVFPDGRPGKHLHCRFVATLLNDLFGIQARGGCSCAGLYGHLLLRVDRNRSKAIKTAVVKGFEGVKPGWTRVSFPYYTSEKEMEFVLDAIELVAHHGRRFLSLYDFDWKTGEWKHVNDEDKIVISSRTTSDVFSEYLIVARSIVESLSEAFEQRKVPKSIDPNLVTFFV